VEEGPHDQLIVRDGPYAQLWRRHAAGTADWPATAPA
jgi:ABC-type multidrug transport system fused ATPase/permease subunit